MAEGGGEDIEMMEFPTDIPDLDEIETDELYEEFERLNDELVNDYDPVKAVRRDYAESILSLREKGISKETSFTDYGFVDDSQVDADDKGGPSIDIKGKQRVVRFASKKKERGAKLVYVRDFSNKDESKEVKKLIEEKEKISLPDNPLVDDLVSRSYIRTLND